MTAGHPIAVANDAIEQLRVGAAHVRELPARPADTCPVPDWLGPDVAARLAAAGVLTLWRHQVSALDAVAAGQNVVVATGTGSGKSLIYQAAAAAILGADPRATAIYLAPTKALGHDQAKSLAWTGLRIGVLDGDTPAEEREWIAAHAQVIITNPDMLGISMLPRHRRWHRVLVNLRLIVVDECHVYRGVFGSHTALVLRRLRRLATRRTSPSGASAAPAAPLVIAASASSSADPAGPAELLVGAPMVAVTEDASPRGRVSVVLRAPEAVGAGSRSEVAGLMTGLLRDGRRTLAFVPSRTGAERVALQVREALGGDAPVRAYRAGLLAEERREIERGLKSGELLGAASTNALELGMDIAGLDAVLLAGWPGRLSSFWQQVGRAGRAGADAVAVLVADDDPLDHYYLSRPEAIFDEPAEVTILDPQNPAVLRQHLLAAAAEAPLTPTDLADFGTGAAVLVDDLVAEGVLRRRPNGVFWPHVAAPEPITDMRGIGGSAVRIVEVDTGRLLGTVDGSAAPATVHPGAVYVHQGEYYLIRELLLDDSVAFAVATGDDVTTIALSRSSLDVLAVRQEQRLGAGLLRLGEVDITRQVYAFQRRRTAADGGGSPGEVLGTHPLELPPQNLRTAAVWWSLPAELPVELGVIDVAGAAHAAEHAAIGLLPLIATCDRWDIGGLSTALHASTGEPTVFVYDGYPGGMGFAARGYQGAEHWLAATRDVVAACECADGCPRCVQSPKCGNGNNPLDKGGAVKLLTALVGPG